MTLPLDHIVIGVHDLAGTRAHFEALGFHVLEGGEHPAPRTSHNALVVFADGAYLELIAWRGPAEGERWYRTLQAHGDGLVDYALLPHDTMEVLEAARARGLLTLHGPVDGGRLRPDGEHLRWRTARHETPDVPFLCGDITPRGLRVPDDAASRTHPNGAVGVSRIEVAVHDIHQARERYRALLGPEARIGEVLRDAAQGLDTVNVALQGFTVVLQSPAADLAALPAPAHALQQRLTTRGEGPCGFTVQRGEGQPPLQLP